MKTNFIKLSALIFSVVIFSSCDKENEPIIEETYKLSSVLWYLDEGDGSVITKEKLPEQIFKNTSSQKKEEVTVNLRDLFGGEISLFECEEKEVFNKWIGEDFYVNVPSFYHSLSSDKVYLVGGNEASLYAGEERKIISNKTMTYSIDLFPNTLVTFNGIIEVKTVTATFIAHFVRDDQQGNGGFQIKGKWTGRLLGGASEKIVVEKIE